MYTPIRHYPSTMNKISFKEFINEVHEAILRDKDVAEGWNEGVVPVFPNYHGNNFLGQEAATGCGSSSNYRNIMGAFSPIPDNRAPPPEGMSRPKSPILLPEDPTKGGIDQLGARTENGDNVNVVASGYSERAPGHTSTMKRCSTKDGVESCVVESDKRADNTWKVRY